MKNGKGVSNQTLQGSAGNNTTTGKGEILIVLLR